MSNLVVLGFDGIHTADEVLNKLRPLQKEYLIDLEDACVVERDSEGKVHIKQAVNLTALGAATGSLRGALWGTLVGILFLNPLAGMAMGMVAGAGAGALSGSLVDYGINDDFVKKLGETIPSGSSALFVLVACSGGTSWVMCRLPPRSRISGKACFAVSQALLPYSESETYTRVFLVGLTNTLVVSIIAGATKPEQVIANAKAAEWKLTDAEVAEIDGITAPRS